MSRQGQGKDIPNPYLAFEELIDEMRRSLGARQEDSPEGSTLSEMDDLSMVLGDHLKRMARLLANDFDSRLAEVQDTQEPLEVLVDELTLTAETMLKFPLSPPPAKLLVIGKYGVTVAGLIPAKESLSEAVKAKLALASERISDVARRLREDTAEQATALDRLAWKLEP